MTESRNLVAVFLIAAAVALTACVTTQQETGSLRSTIGGKPSSPELPPPSRTSTTPPPPQTSNDKNTNPTAMRLWELNGLALQYYVDHGQRVPERIEDLAMKENPHAIIDPASNLPFIYTPEGVPYSPPRPSAIDQPGSVIFRQPVTDADGFCWVSMVVKSHTGKGTITDVFRVRAKFIQPAPPTPAAQP